MPARHTNDAPPRVRCAAVHVYLRHAAKFSRRASAHSGRSPGAGEMRTRASMALKQRVTSAASRSNPMRLWCGNLGRCETAPSVLIVSPLNTAARFSGSQGKSGTQDSLSCPQAGLERVKFFAPRIAPRHFAQEELALAFV